MFLVTFLQLALVCLALIVDLFAMSLDFGQFEIGRYNDGTFTDSCHVSYSNIHKITRNRSMPVMPTPSLVLNRSSSSEVYNSGAKREPHELHVLVNASERGAVCLDGSPPGYYLRSGKGSDTTKWIIFFQGGAWCHDVDTCYQRSQTSLGSSKCFGRSLYLEGLLSGQAQYNPEFFTWTSVFVPYCDGGVFYRKSSKTHES